MRYSRILFVLLLGAILLAACSPIKTPVKYSMGTLTSSGCSTPAADKAATCKVKGAIDPTSDPTQTVKPQLDLTRSDAQGSVTVEITPLNLDKPGDTLIFAVSMNTHVVDLSMDLVKLSTLKTDSGQTVQAIQWDGPSGGHHVDGKLIFPATYEGKSMLNGAKSLTISVDNVDASTRLFTWKITK